MTGQTTRQPTEPIDAVITWVDGSTPAHQRKRQHYMALAGGPLLENATNPHRWASNDELLFCLQSIHNHAPWVRTIWIVVEQETPDLSGLSAGLRGKIRFAFHKDIFGEFASALPTFNSLAIETVLWRIDGLSERFLYFNDDVFLTAPLLETDVFVGPTPVLRGRWADMSGAVQGEAARRDPARFNHFMQVNAAALLGYEAKHLFAAAHVMHPFLRSTMAQLFETHRQAFEANISHRFRDLSQFLPQGLHNHACIARADAVLGTAQDYLHIRSGQGVGEAQGPTRALLQSVRAQTIKVVCINDLPQLEGVVPEVRSWLAEAVGGFDETTGNAP